MRLAALVFVVGVSLVNGVVLAERHTLLPPVVPLPSPTPFSLDRALSTSDPLGLNTPSPEQVLATPDPVAVYYHNQRSRAHDAVNFRRTSLGVRHPHRRRRSVDPASW